MKVAQTKSSGSSLYLYLSKAAVPKVKAYSRSDYQKNNEVVARLFVDNTSNDKATSSDLKWRLANDVFACLTLRLCSFRPLWAF